MNDRLIAYRAVIWDKDELEALLKCGGCFEYYPLDPEFWELKQGFNRCRECTRLARQAAGERCRRRQGMVTNKSGASKRAASRRYYAENAVRLRQESLERHRARRALAREQT